jgi:hypothetical protein
MCVRMNNDSQTTKFFITNILLQLFKMDPGWVDLILHNRCVPDGLLDQPQNGSWNGLFAKSGRKKS